MEGTLLRKYPNTCPVYIDVSHTIRQKYYLWQKKRSSPLRSISHKNDDIWIKCILCKKPIQTLLIYSAT